MNKARARVQIAWRWTASHLPAGERMRWHFVAHGAAYERSEADEHAELLERNGKVALFLPLPDTSDA